MSSLSLTTNSFHSLGLQFSTTLVCEDRCRASVIGFILAHYILKTSKGRFFSYYFMFTNLSVNQSQSARISFDVRKRVSVFDALRFLFSHLSAKIGGFLLLIFYSVDIDYKPADKGFKPMTHRNSTMTPGESDWFCSRSLT